MYELLIWPMVWRLCVPLLRSNLARMGVAAIATAVSVQTVHVPAPHAATLQEVCSLVPHLVERCACISTEPEGGIRALRLVNKDLARVALSAVRSCAVQFGEGAFLNPSRLAEMFSTSCMQSMDVTVLVKAGMWKC